MKILTEQYAACVCLTFELPLGAGLDLLRLGHSLDQFLDNHTVTVTSITVKMREMFNMTPGH